MRTIKAEEITRRVATLCIEANTCLPADERPPWKAREEEPWPLAKQTLGLLRSNLTWPPPANCPSARTPAWPACLWSWARTTRGRAPQRPPSMRRGRGYGDGYLRKSVVATRCAG